MESISSNKRKRNHTQTPKPLGVLEFTSALNGDDPISVLKKLRHFVNVVSYQRRWALCGENVDKASKARDVISTTEADDDGGEEVDAERSDDDSILSFDNDDDDTTDEEHPNKRQKAQHKSISKHTKKKKAPEWQQDKNNYNVPFVGTSLAKGATGVAKPNQWPTGFLEAYLNQIPLGVELVKNEYLSAVPPGGIHRGLCKESGNREDDGFGGGMKDGRGKKRHGMSNWDSESKSRGQIISMALQSAYWMALSEWVSGFIPVSKLKRELEWKSLDPTDGTARGKDDKCTVPPQIMTILMKERLPEWVKAIHDYSVWQHQASQQIKQLKQKPKQQQKQKQKQSKAGTQQQSVKKSPLELEQEEATGKENQDKQRKLQKRIQKEQRRQEALLLSALKNLTGLCHLSIGTAREILRRLTMSSGSNSSVGGARVGGRFKDHTHGTNNVSGGGGGDGISWMVRLFQQQDLGEKSEDRYESNPQLECLQLACTLLETRDFHILSQICEVPSWLMKRAGGSSGGKGSHPFGSTAGNFGVVYVSMRYGIQRLLEMKRYEEKKGDDGVEEERPNVGGQKRSDVYCYCIARLLKNVRSILIPPPCALEDEGKISSKGSPSSSRDGFVIGLAATTELLSGETLGNLATLSQLAPSYEASKEFINILVDGGDTYETLTPLEMAAIEARRLLFLLLIDRQRSPFLYGVHHQSRGGKIMKSEELSSTYFPQLAKQCHNLIKDQSYSISIKMLMVMCINSTPQFAHYFFKGMQLPDPKPNYKTLAALSFLEGILRDAPSPQKEVAGSGYGSQMIGGVASYALVPTCITKAALGKIILSPSALLVTSGLKLIITVLRRAYEYVSSFITFGQGNWSTVESREVHKSVCHEIMRHLPEVSQILSILSRFDPFKLQSNNTPSRASAAVVLLLCEAICCYSQLEPSMVSNVKFDWAKLLPNETSSHSSSGTGSQDQLKDRNFFHAEPLLQQRILQTLFDLSQLYGISFSSKMLPTVLSILTSTNVSEVYDVGRKLALKMMELELFPQVNGTRESSSEKELCQKYETSLWIDGINTNLIMELEVLLEDSKQQRVQQKILISQAWSKASKRSDMPTTCFSALLSSTIFRLLGNGNHKHPLSTEFSFLLIQIAVKVLLFQRDPSLLAAVIVFSAGLASSNNDGLTGVLYKIANCVLNEDSNASHFLELLSSKLFDPNLSVTSIDRMTSGIAIHMDDYLMELRRCFSLLNYSQSTYDELCLHIRNTLVCALVNQADSIPGVISMLQTAPGTSIIRPTDKECFVMLLLSLGRMDGLDTTEASLSSNSTGMNVVSTLLRCDLVPCDQRPVILSFIWENCFSVVKSCFDSSLRDFLLAALLYALPLDESQFLLPFPLEEVFDLWSLLAANLSTKLSITLCFRLESYLSESFESLEDAKGIWVVYRKICDVGQQKFMDLCFGTLRKKMEMKPGGHCEYISNANDGTLLSSVLGYDSSEFDCFAYALAGINHDSGLSKLWKNGWLDKSAATFLHQVANQNNTANIKSSPFYSKGASTVANRFFSFLGEDHYHSVTFEAVINGLHAIGSRGLMIPEIASKLQESFDALGNGVKTISEGHEIRILELAQCITLSIDKTDLELSVLLSTSFLRCCIILPKYLKKMLRTKQESHISSLAKLIHLFSYFFQHKTNFETTSISASSSTIDGFIVACLKYGIFDCRERTSCSLLGGCLKVIRLILRYSFSITDNAFGTITPRQVHAMAISHSSFKTAITGSSPEMKKQEMPGESPVLVQQGSMPSFCSGLTQQMELIRLLLCCMSLDPKQIQIDNETLSTILFVYNAGTSNADKLLRRLIFLYEQHENFHTQHSMGIFRWGSALGTELSTKLNSIGRQDFEWFVEVLESERIRATLSQFPVSDGLEPMQDVDAEAVSNDHVDENSNKPGDEYAPDTDVECDDISSTSISTSSDDISSDHDQKASMKYTYKGDSSCDIWRGDGADIRYSPGFILPFILATFESYVPQEGVYNDHQKQQVIISEHEENKGSNPAQYQAFGQIARRLCDKGGVSLAVASLSSRCPKLRKVAVAICGLFLRALQMQEAHEIKSWRERPQQELLMSSVQRGLAVRRSLQIQKLKETRQGIILGDDTSLFHHLNVPMLPALSSVFLSRALLIISRPEDDMYGPINRYFLRLNEFHGAFQDCFGLPAFLSLYCSSSDDISRCKVERNWALQMLRESSVDEFCYQVIAQHHVPELLMTSFDSLLDFPGSKGEQLITTDVLKVLIESGGLRASNHVVNRLGLLSWLHGVTNWRKISSVFPYVELKCKFLKLIIAAVQSYDKALCLSDGDEEAEKPYFFEKVPLAHSVLRIFAEATEQNKNEMTSNHEIQNELLFLTCDALWAIYNADKNPTNKINPGSLGPGMSTLNDMLSVLKRVVSHEEVFAKVMVSFCTLPFAADDGESSSAEHFCELTLAFILEKRLQISFFPIVLSKVHDLLLSYHSLRRSPKISHQIMKCRCLAVLSDGGTAAWEKLYRCLTLDTK